MNENHPSKGRMPAANESRFLWRAVVGLAVMGVAILIWRQSDEPMFGDAPQTVAAGSQATSVQETGTTQTAEVAPQEPASVPEEEFLRLLRVHFPTQYQSAQGHRLWLVRDPDGQMLLTGELEPEQRLHDLDEQLGRGLAGRTPGPWQVRQLRNGAGQLIELAIADVELGEPSH